MRQIQRPTSRQLFELYDLIGEEVRVLATLKQPPSEKEPKYGGMTASEWAELDAAGAFTVNLFRHAPPFAEPKPKPSLLAEVVRVEGQLMGNAALQWLRTQEPFLKLQESLGRKAKKDSSGPFAKPVATYWLIQCVAFSLGLHVHYLATKRKLGQMSRKDWDDAIEAVQTLRRLEKERGLKLISVFKTDPNRQPSWNGAEQFEARLIEARQDAKKPHDDGFISDRAATRRFAVLLLAMFNEAPTNMVEKFAELIGYNSDSIRKQLKAWEQAYRTGSLV